MLETVLSFILKVARMAFGLKKKRKHEACPCHLPDGADVSVGNPTGERGEFSSDRSDTLSLQRTPESLNSINIMGWCLILSACL